MNIDTGEFRALTEKVARLAASVEKIARVTDLAPEGTGIYDKTINRNTDNGPHPRITQRDQGGRLHLVDGGA